MCVCVCVCVCVQSSLEKGFGYFFRRLDDVAQELLLSNAPPHTHSLTQPLPNVFVHTAMSIYDYGTVSNKMTGVNPPLFGTSLRHLLQSEVRCSTAYSARSVGVPNQVNAMLDSLTHSLTTPGLFIRPASLAAMQALRVSLENECGVPDDTSPFTVASCVMQWLYELPEPLLGFDTHDALQACQRDIHSHVHRLRNFTLLVDAAPWYCKPTLHRVMELVTALTRPESSRCTGLTVVHLSTHFAACLLRPAPECSTLVHAQALSQENVESVIHTTAVSGPVADVLILHAHTVFEPLATHMRALHDRLSEKVTMLESIQAMSVKYISDPSQSPPYSSLYKLWTALAPCEELLREQESSAVESWGSSGSGSGSGSSENSSSVVSEEDRDVWLRSVRWKICFPTHHSSDASESSEGVSAVELFDMLPGGQLAVDSLATFLQL